MSKRSSILTLVFALLASNAIGDTAFGDKLAEQALERTNHNVIYDPSYYSIAYPNGDVPTDRGVCTDVVIRSYRALGIDLQKEVHEDMKVNFSAYPKYWGLKRTDSNIDHRRVPNLQTFFTRKGQSLSISDKPEDYLPGDVVSWNLNPAGRLDHIGIVTKTQAADGTPLIAHNIGSGPKEENILFAFKITGHYRYAPLVE